MFQLKSILAGLVMSILGMATPSFADSCWRQCQGLNEALPLSDEDYWPWAVTDLWENIEGVWEASTEDGEVDYYRFEIIGKHNRNLLSVKIEFLDGPHGPVLGSYRGWGDLEKQEMSTTVTMSRQSYLMQVRAYDQNRQSCRQPVCTDRPASGDEEVVIGLIMTPYWDGQGEKEYRLLRRLHRADLVNEE